LGLEKPNSGLDPGETNSGSDLVSAETFQISRNLGLDIDEIVCLLDSTRYSSIQKSEAAYVGVDLKGTTGKQEPAYMKELFALW